MQQLRIIISIQESSWMEGLSIREQSIHASDRQDTDEYTKYATYMARRVS
jgi:hypothetical protein